MSSTTQYIQQAISFPDGASPNIIINTSIECMELDDVKLVARDSNGDVHDLIQGNHYTITGTRNEGAVTTTNVVITLRSYDPAWAGAGVAASMIIDLIAYRETDVATRYLVRLGYSRIADINIVSEAARLRDEEALHYGIKVVGFDTKKVLKIFDTDRDYYYGYDDTGAPVLLTQDDFRDSIIAGLDATIAEIEAARDASLAGQAASAASAVEAAASALVAEGFAADADDAADAAAISAVEAAASALAADGVTSLDGQIGALTLADLSLDQVDNTSDANKPVSTATQTALDLKADQASISNIDNTSDANKPVSGPQAAVLATKADVSDIDNIDNTSDATKVISGPISTALGLKADQSSISNIDNTSDANKPVSGPQAAALLLKANDADISLVGKTNLYSDLTGLPAIPAELSDLSDVDTTGALEGQGLILNDLGVFVPGNAGGGGSGSKNYIDQDSAEFETTVGNWLSDDGTGTPDPLFYTYLETTAFLAGEKSLGIIANGGGAFNSFIKCASKTIAPIDRGKILHGSFSYDTTFRPGLFIYNDGDYRLEVYDVTNDEVLYSGSEEDLSIPVGKGRFSFATHTETTTAQVELRIVCDHVPASAKVALFDEFEFGPASYVSSVLRKSLVIDLAGSGDFLTGGIQVERVGNIVTVSALDSITHGSSAAPASAVGVLPEWARPENQKGALYSQAAEWRTVFVEANGQISTRSKTNTGAASNQTSTLASLTISYTVPELSSPTISDSELSLQTISAQVYLAANQIVSSTAITTVQYDSVFFDTHGVFESASFGFRIPKTGKYRVDLLAQITSLVDGDQQVAAIRVNGGQKQRFIERANSDGLDINFSRVIELNKNDLVDFYVDSSADSSYAVRGGINDGYFGIESVQDYSLLGVTTEGITHAETATDNYVKFPDGTMIAYLDITVTDQSIGNAYGSLWQGTRVWTFPEEFVSPPSVTCSLFRWGTSDSWGSLGARPTSTQAILRGIDVSSRATGTSTDIQAMAIGRWR